MGKITGLRISVISIATAISLTILDYFSSNPKILTWSYWSWLPCSFVSLYSYAYDTRPTIRDFHDRNKNLILLIVLLAISLLLSFVRYYYLEDSFADELRDYAFAIKKRFLKPGFIQWFRDYENKHKFRILQPLLVGVLSRILPIGTIRISILVSVVSTIFCLRYISEMCKLRNFSDNDRYIVLYTFTASPAIINNAAKGLTDMLALLLVIMCLFYYSSYQETGTRRDLLLAWIIMFLAIATREIAFLLPFVLWIVPTNRLDWRKRTLIFMVPLGIAFTIFIQFFSWDLLRQKFTIFYCPGYLRPFDAILCHLGRIREQHLEVEYLIKWFESLTYVLLIPGTMAIFAIPFKDIIRQKFEGYIDLAWAVTFLTVFFIVRTARVLGRHLLPIGWVIYFWVPEGTRKFLERFELNKKWYQPIVGAIILLGFLVSLIRLAVLLSLVHFDFIEWIRKVHT